MEQLQDATRELIRIQNEQRKLGVDLQVAIDKASAGGPPEVLHQELNTALRQDAKYNTLLADLIRHQKALDASRQKARNPRDAAVKNIHNETLQIQAELADHVDVVREAILAKKERSGSNSQITQIEEQLIKLGELERIVNGEVKVLEASTKKAGRESFELEALRDELKQDDETLAKVNQEISMLGFELQAEERVKLWNRAYSPYTLNMKKQILATAAAGLGSAGFIMFAVALWEVRRKRVDTAEQIVQGLGLDLVGVLPALPSRSRKALASEGSRDQHWDHILLESVDATCAMLLHASRAEGLQTIMVVSAVTGEGKTSLACHLATSLARARRRTLLIDCDLRNPAAHLMYGLPLEGGVCEILRGEIEVADSIQPTMANGLSMITAGHCDPIAIQALSHGGIEPIFEKLKAEFDYIVIDSAPILPVADSLHISQHVDAALFSVLRDVSRLPKIYAAYERLAKLGVRILGAVVSGTPCEDYRSVYSYSAASRGAGRLSTVGE
jgi:capsular exopolysaccharide synthesis family protein